MKGKLLTAFMIVLALFNVFSFIQNTSAQNRISDLEHAVETKTNKTYVVQAKDGQNGKDGVDGVNAVSFSITQLTLKEIPLLGETGKSAYDLWIEQGNTGTIEDFLNSLRAPEAPRQMLEIDPATKDMITKLSTDKYWTVLVPCTDYRLECPNGN